MSLLPILLALACAAGLTLIADGLRRRPPGSPARRRRPWTSVDRARLLAAVAGGVGAGVVTRWPVAVLLAGAAVWALPRVLGPDREHTRAVARIEAIATWAELLRDTLSSAAGLEQAITATAPVTPQPIRPQVQALAGAVRGGARLPDALRVFADDLADPTADLVVRALTQAAGYHGGQLSQCLTSLAVTARELAGIRMRVAAKRAATRTAARVITGTAAAMVAGLILLNRGFLAPYGTVTGQLVLLVVGAVFAAGFWWLARVSRLPEPPRVFAGPAGTALGAGRAS
ncbi:MULTISPECIES: type II secretion system F family protein [unclassified Micromonospora]|uniref:type II secretion system F family protein n=1 Tax=unclassified Micromonospora TaxID=2617518 RepID=UPI00259CE177|nr:MULTISPECIES: type II secretion system F family protein [unclassified Micromonospora]MDM4783408.1 type II secretion system F family protein [Micromonospora sp. b486]